ncbi:MAG: dodecin family protein [Arenicellales bacterium]
MSVAKVTEIISSSKKSFDDAIENGVKRASSTLKGVTSAWIKDQSVTVKNGKIEEYRVNMAVTFVLDIKGSAARKNKRANKKK